MVASNKDIAVVGVIALILGLVIFGGRQLFGAITSGDLKFPEINLPDINLPDINFPEITFPSFDFGGLFQGFNPFPNAELDDEGNVIPLELSQPGEGGLNPADDPTNPTPLDILLNPGPGIAPGQAPPSGNDILLSMFNPPGAFGFGILGTGNQGISTMLAQALGISNLTQGQISTQQVSALSAIGLDVSQLGMLPGAFNFGLFSDGQPQVSIPGDPFEPEQVNIPEILPPVTVAPGIEAPAGFEGGGPSFMGGTINETPIENLSLNQIIEMGLAESATEAANLQAIAMGFTQEEEMFLNQGPTDVGGFMSGGPPAVSDPQFGGLSPEEIFAQLVGGNINNF